MKKEKNETCLFPKIPVVLFWNQATPKVCDLGEFPASLSFSAFIHRVEDEMGLNSSRRLKMKSKDCINANMTVTIVFSL